MAEQRTKEVGIRKVLGASAGELVALLCREYLVIVSLASLLAWPVAAFAMHIWLRNFAYRVHISPWNFIASGLAALATALLTVSFQALKAATANPARALRHE